MAEEEHKNPFEKEDNKIAAKKAEYEEAKARLAESGLAYSDEDIRILNRSIQNGIFDVIAGKSEVEKVMHLQKKVDRLERKRYTKYGLYRAVASVFKRYFHDDDFTINIFEKACYGKAEEVRDLLQTHEHILDPLFKFIIDHWLKNSNCGFRYLAFIFKNLDLVEQFPDQIDIMSQFSYYELALVAFRQDPDFFDNNLINVLPYKEYFMMFSHKELPKEKITKALTPREWQNHDENKTNPFAQAKVRYAFKILHDICGDDYEKRQIVMELGDGNEYSHLYFEVALKYKYLYEDDTQKLTRVVKALKKIDTTWHEQATQKTLKVTSVALEYVNKKAKPQSIDELEEIVDTICLLMPKPYGKSYYAAVYGIGAFLGRDDKEIEQFAQIIKKYCSPDIHKQKLILTYLKNGYPFNEEIIEIFVTLGMNNENFEVDMKEFGEAYVGRLLQKPDWYQQIFEVHQYKELRQFLPQWLQDYCGVIEQTNVAALAPKIHDHFKPIADKVDDAQKINLFKIHGDFLSEFNGTLVPMVWHLYYLLKDPGDAAKFLSNFKDLNNLREQENIADLADLQTRIHDIKEGILLGNVDLDQYLESGFKLAILDDMAKVTASDWKRQNRPLSAIVTGFKQDEPQIQATFNPKVYKNGFIPVKEIVGQMERDPALTENVIKIQSVIKRFIQSDENVFIEEDQIVKLLIEDLAEKVDSGVRKTQIALAKGENARGEILNDKAKQFMVKSIDALRSFAEQVSDIKSLQQMIHVLLGNKPKDIDCEAEILTIFYYLGAQKQNLNNAESWVHQDPTLVDASTLDGFIRDTIFLEVVGGKSNNGKSDIPLDASEKKDLKRQFSGINNFLHQKQEEEAAYKAQATSNVKNIAVLAGRGILAELSGFYCDACWTQQANILKDNPNMVGHTMVENFEEKEKSKIIGGCLTLESSIQVAGQESSEENNAKVLLVRGLNPQNAYIKKYDVGAFVESFLDYVQEAARKAGAEYVVLPLYSTGALSNRPEINTYLATKYGNIPRVSLNDDIKFNNYAIKDACVVVRVVKENKRQGKLPKPSNVPLDKQDQWIGSW